MPSVDDMFNKNVLNVSLDRIIAGNPGTPTTRQLNGIFVNLVRLSDKSLREYDAARAELMAYVENYEDNWGINPYVRAIDHMENCIDATHRAVLNAAALRINGFGRKALKVTEHQERRLRFFRNTIEHIDERLIGTPRRNRPNLQAADPFTLRLANKVMVIGQDSLTYRELVAIITKMYVTIEAIRGPSVRPGDVWSNAALRTDPRPVQRNSTLRFSNHVKEFSRLVISH
jgi:hypothetical protein